MVVNQSQLLD